MLAEKPQARTWKCWKGRCYLLQLSLQPWDENALASLLVNSYLLVFVIWKGKCTRNNSLQVIGFWVKGLLNCDLSLYLEFANANEFTYFSHMQQDIQFTLLPPDFQKKQQSRSYGCPSVVLILLIQNCSPLIVTHKSQTKAMPIKILTQSRQFLLD